MGIRPGFRDRCGISFGVDERTFLMLRPTHILQVDCDRRWRFVALILTFRPSICRIEAPPCFARFLPMAQTYIAWRRHTLLAAIDALPGATGPEAAAAFEDLLRHLNHSLPTQEITATLDDLIKAQPHLCSAHQLEAMRAFRDHLAVAV
jgi:hypothetical protein